MERIATQFYQTSLLSTRIFNRRISPIYFLILTTAVISASTEFYFLYEHSVYPMFRSIYVAIPLSLIAVTFIEILKIIGFQSVIQSLHSWKSTTLLAFLLVAPAIGVSWFISLSGAYVIQEKSTTPPMQATQAYKDSVNNYYSSLITSIRTNPSSSTNKRIESLTSDINSLKKEVENIQSNDKNYIGGEMAWEVRNIIANKEKTISNLFATKNKLIASDKSGIDADKEIARLEREKIDKFQEINEAKELFLTDSKNDKNIAFWYILINEFFALVLNGISTFTKEHRSKSEEEIQAEKEKATDKVFNMYYRQQFPSKRKAQQAYLVAIGKGEGDRINDSKFNSLFNDWCEFNGKLPKKKRITRNSTKLHDITHQSATFTQN